ncbi:hypothetical protein QQM39_03060 [Streptomyces sp. DT2A-34]|uniref:hypothetical protein n=1 Tax=Streptomyces sp. DT2A-34 TaxID=3051182 RepID=UPI00265BAC49|nr:hypothetical protein [Streptomyces sp. DT2A-34]MDO0909876.1 hypothetical protein [Streptomyces sp. DT2A-34]
MEGVYFKDATDEDGNVIPQGQIRKDPWVVIELVSQAVAVLERLQPGRSNAMVGPAAERPSPRTWKVSWPGDP